MENKYYTPDISEFHVGFEYERCDNGYSYFKDIYPRAVNQNKLENYLPYFRVKYLDKDDIESLGFSVDESRKSLMSDDNPDQIDYVFHSKNYGSEYKLLYCNWWTTAASSKEELNGKITIDNTSEHRLVRIQRKAMKADDYNTIFSGDIKNKSELKRILKMIGYDEN